MNNASSTAKKDIFVHNVRGTEGTFDWRKEAAKLNPCATKKQTTDRGKQVAQEVQISPLGCDSSNIYITAWSDQLKKRINICVDAGVTCLFLKVGII